MSASILALPGTTAMLAQAMAAKPLAPTLIQQDDLGIVYSSKIDWRMWDQIPTTMLDLEYFNQAHPDNGNLGGLLDVYM